MTRILAISSFVAAGHVGLSAAVPALARLGAEVMAVPTVVLSNHKAWPAVAGEPVPPERIAAMLDAIAANGWLAEADALLTGYLPSAAHVDAAGAAALRLRAANPHARVVVDPVLGDDPRGLYLAAEAAEAIRDRLAPLADLLTPNRFELEWLTGRPAGDLAAAAEAARALAGRGRRVLVTSPPLDGDGTGALDVSAAGARLHRVPRRQRVPHGVGDAFAAMAAAGLPAGEAVGKLAALVGTSLGRPHLAIVSGDWPSAPAVPGEPV